MHIQPMVQSTSWETTYTSSVSATGVEQGASRTSLPPVEETTHSSATQNRDAPFPTLESRQAAEKPAAEKDSPSTAATTNSSAHPSAKDPDGELSVREKLQEEADQALLAQLKARDREVRIHEAAHASVGGQYAGGASFEYQRGPDGQRYAVGGEVGISTAPITGNPEATIEKARTIQAAALAPAEPSAQDRQVAAQAARMEVDARVEMQQMEQDAKSTEADAAKTAPEARAANASKDSDRTDSSQSPTAETKPPADNAVTRAYQQGRTDPQNPFGKNGFVDVIA